MTGEGEAILAQMQAIVERSTWLVCPRPQVPRDVILRGQHPDTGRSLLFAHPSQLERITAGLRFMNVPHEIEGETPDGST
jgi:hypothetical protein